MRRLIVSLAAVFLSLTAYGAIAGGGCGLKHGMPKATTAYTTPATQSDVADETAAAVVALSGGVSLVTAPLGGRAADEWGARPVAVGSLVLSAVVLACFPLMRTLPAIAGAAVALALVSESFRPADMALYGCGAG